MELNADWKRFHSIFYPTRRSLVKGAQSSTASEHAKTAFGILEGETLVCAFLEGFDFSDSIGSTREDLEHKFPELRWIYFDRSMMDAWVAGSLGMSHAVAQMEYLRENAEDAVMAGAGKSKRRDIEEAFSKRHFLLEGLRSWWGKVLPSSYGIYIRLESQKDDDLMIVVRQGQLESYSRPDLGTLGEERGKDREQIIKYLAEKHLVPVQGIFLSSEEWAHWNSGPNPWKKVALSIRAERVRLMPFRWSLVGLIAARGFLG